MDFLVVKTLAITRRVDQGLYNPRKADFFFMIHDVEVTLRKDHKPAPTHLRAHYHGPKALLDERQVLSIVYGEERLQHSLFSF